MSVYLTAVAAVWGIVAGLALPRAIHRLAVASGEPVRADDEDGLPYPPGPRGWIGGSSGNSGSSDNGGTGTRQRPYGTVLLCVTACAALAALVGARPELVVWLLLVPLGVLLARIDLAVFRLPDVLTLPALAGTAALLGGAALLPGHEGSWPRALLGGVVLGAVYFLLFLINPAGMGFGDVKLAPTLGLALGWYGWPVLFAGTFAGFVLGAVAGLVLLATRRANRKTPLPFGPFMLIGALGGVLLATA
ncbi:prepilin peptidase [Streptomyces sp. SID13666]|uniref:prepilin peptidase n=1 Tax=unclassified Streptomyces TaxID=2593676 RepID=UPI0013C03982|nr:MULTISPECIES: A24 family peptidase [unclassified Streptomyces]NEA58429.1 prepilin peptidase [Streptomyces sp. SID13666]NEA73601.1 prepilin peptidase [Streptomyces sp. SID13588]